LTADDHVVVNPPDGVASGDKVRVAGAKDAPDGAKTAEAK
jgi:hypothetical protein